MEEEGWARREIAGDIQRTVRRVFRGRGSSRGVGEGGRTTAATCRKRAGDW